MARRTAKSGRARARAQRCCRLDLLIYNNAALDLIAWDVCRHQMDLEYVNWTAFYDRAAADKLFFSE